MKVSPLPILTVIGMASAIFVLNGCQERVPPSVSSGNFASLEGKFDELIHGDPPMGSLVVNVGATSDFIEFSRSEGSVFIDFPVITDRQKELEPVFRKVCGDLGLTIVETVDPEGNRFLGAKAESDPAELSRVSKIFLSQLFGVDENGALDFTLHPSPR